MSRSSPLPPAGFYERGGSNPEIRKTSSKKVTTSIMVQKAERPPDRPLSIESLRRRRDFERLDQS